MYGLPSDFDASVFIGRELQMVAFTVNTVHLSFDGEVELTIETSFDVQLDDTSEAVRQAPPVQTSSLMSLVGRTIRSARAHSDGTLMLDFSGGGTLTCIDDSKEYESYHIRVHGREIDV